MTGNFANLIALIRKHATWWMGGFLLLIILVVTGFTILRSPAATAAAEKWTPSGTMVLPAVTSTDTHRLIDGTYRMYYGQGDQIVYANSTDAVTFSQPQPTGIQNDLGKLISNPAVLEIKSNQWIMIYEESPSQKGPGPSDKSGPPDKSGPTDKSGPPEPHDLYLATSSDGMNFTKAGLAVDSSKEDSDFASVANLILMPDGTVRMYYVCGGQAVCLRTSSDDGHSWIKDPSFQLNEPAGDPDVLHQGNRWVMYYTNLIPNTNGLYKAVSSDGISWTPLSGQIIRKQNPYGVIVDPDVVVTPDGSYKMFYGEAPDNNSPIDLYSATFKGNIF